MSQELMNIVLSALGIIVTGLATFAVTKLTAFLNEKIKNQKFNNLVQAVFDIILKCVQEVNQTYVEELKNKNIFDKEAQKNALDMCLKKVKSQLSADTLKLLAEYFGDIDSYLTTVIESTVNTLK